MGTEGLLRAGVAILGLGGPIAVGVLSGHAGIWMVAALGSFALTRSAGDHGMRGEALSLLRAIAAGTAAILTGSAMAGHAPWLAFGIPLTIAAAGLLGSLSRPLARAAVLFGLYTIIATGLGARGIHPLGAALLFLLGATWTACLSLGLGSLFRALHPFPLPPAADDAARPSGPGARRLLRRWLGALAHLSGWQYPLRILVCLFAAQAFESLRPLHHGYWVGLTVAIVVQRDLRDSRRRALQRAAGTALGVLLVCPILIFAPPAWAVIATLIALAAARPILREASYVAYAMVHTPAIILLMDFGRAPSWAVVGDRLIATLVGCAIAIAIGYLPWQGRLRLSRQTRRLPLFDRSRHGKP